jgi:hypothetical protein
MDLGVLLDPKIDLPRLSHVLDELGHLGRLHTIHGWDGATLARLYDAAQGFRPVTLEDIVPSSTPDKTQVIHHGKNSLALFSHFQKRFAKSLVVGDSAEPTLWGYNFQTMAAFTGPGYFVARKGTTEGEVDIDYRSLPAGKLDEWPEIVPNSSKLGRFVYAGMIDRLRGISSHVSIGRAEKGGQAIDAWFALCREDPA